MIEVRFNETDIPTRYADIAHSKSLNATPQAADRLTIITFHAVYRALLDMFDPFYETAIVFRNSDNEFICGAKMGRSNNRIDYEWSYNEEDFTGASSVIEASSEYMAKYFYISAYNLYGVGVSHIAAELHKHMSIILEEIKKWVIDNDDKADILSIYKVFKARCDTYKGKSIPSIVPDEDVIKLCFVNDDDYDKKGQN